MKNIEITKEFAALFKHRYRYSMGGKQTLVFPGGQRFEFDDRKYYNGRGTKYNKTIRHDDLGEIIITEEEIKVVLERDRKSKEKQERMALAKAKGLYSLRKEEYGSFVELSAEEMEGQYFDAERLANTLKISVKDAELLNSKGKTYVLATAEDGTIYELYHASLFCNPLNISISVATKERVQEFQSEWEEWESAPYSYLVGQTENRNHFVC